MAEHKCLVVEWIQYHRISRILFLHYKIHTLSESRKHPRVVVCVYTYIHVHVQSAPFTTRIKSIVDFNFGLVFLALQDALLWRIQLICLHSSVGRASVQNADVMGYGSSSCFSLKLTILTELHACSLQSKYPPFLSCSSSECQSQRTHDPIPISAPVVYHYHIGTYNRGSSEVPYGLNEQIFILNMCTCIHGMGFRITHTLENNCLAMVTSQKVSRHVYMCSGLISISS